MTANVDIDVTANASDTDEGDITFTSTINDTDGTSPFSLTLDGDGGAIAVQGIIGGTNKVGAISINNTITNRPA